MKNFNTILSMTSVSKSFPGVKALDNVSIQINLGEIHGLVGENGAGKSTLIKVLAGVHIPESGSIDVSGKPILPLSSNHIHEAGVRFIHQELHLVPHFSVAESVFMGQEISSVLGLRKKEMQLKTQHFFKEVFGIDIDSKKLVRHLSVTEKKMVQITRALIDGKAKVIVFDEPTAVLGSQEASQLIQIIKKLKERDVSIIYISHYLSEITEICDRVTVLRNGQKVDVVEAINKNSSQHLIKLMVGREINCMYPEKNGTPKSNIGLQVNRLSDKNMLSEVSFQIKKGETLGVAGLLGSGREELIDCIYGIKQRLSGTISINGRKLLINSPADAVKNGMVLVPRDRRKAGVVLNMDVTENINLGSYSSVSNYTIENRKQSQRRAKQQIDDLDIRPPYLDVVTKNFSGGNQQKIVLGRWLCTEADVFIFDEPTVGVDIGAKTDIYQLIDNLARKGASIIVSSSDPAELIGICDRVLVMKRGVVDCELDTNELEVDELINVTTQSEVRGG